MNVALPSILTSTQVVNILTDVQVTNPTIVCPITVTLTPAAAYISLSGDYTTINLNESLLTSPTDLGTNPFVLNVNSATFPGTVTQQTFNFNVIVSECVVTTLTFSTSPPASTTVQIGIDSQPVTLPFAVTQTPECNKTIVFTLQVNTPSFIGLTGITASGGNVQISGATMADNGTNSVWLDATIAAET